MPGLGVILTSVVLRAVENSRIKACMHWENTNWRIGSIPHLLFSLNIPLHWQPFITAWLKARSVSCRTVAPLETTKFSWKGDAPAAAHMTANKGRCFAHLCIQIQYFPAILKLHFHSAPHCRPPCQGQVCYFLHAASKFNDCQEIILTTSQPDFN